MRLRVEKLQELIKQEVSKMLLKEIKDPRIGFVTVTDVEMTGDLREAKIFVSIMGNEEQVKNSWAGLQSSLGFVRREIGHRIRLRFTPFVSFALDKSLDYGEHIQKLLLQIEKESAEKNLIPPTRPLGASPQAPEAPTSGSESLEAPPTMTENESPEASPTQGGNRSISKAPRLGGGSGGGALLNESSKAPSKEGDQ